MTSAILPLFAAFLAGSIRAFAGSMLLLAGLAKLRRLAEFEAMLAAYRLVPTAPLRLVARLLTLCEIIVGGALFAPAPASWPSLVAAAMLVVFSIAVAINLGRGRRHLECGCGFGSTISWRLVAGNGALAAALLAGVSVPEAFGMTWAAAIVAGVATQILRMIAATLASIGMPRISHRSAL